MGEFLPFAVPDVGDEEIREVVEAIRNGWLTTGPKTRQFEREFAAFLGGDVEALAVNSATAGLHLALEAVGIGPGDEVITTPYTFTATAEVVRYLGAHPKFADIDPATLNVDPRQIEAAVGPKTKAILPVHFGGLACDMDAILAIAARHGLKVIEDAAHSLPATSGGRMIGTLASDATVFSFYATKTLATGEGGMVVTRNTAIRDRCRLMRLHGIDRDAFDRYSAKVPQWEYRVMAPGFKYNMTDLAAALGLPQLRRMNQLRDTRAAMAARYDAAFRTLPVELPPHAPAGEVHAWHLYVIRLRPEAGIDRAAFIERMSQKGIGCSVHFIPLHLQPVWRDLYDLRPESFPAALKAYEAAVSLPLYTKMTGADQDRVIEAVAEILA
jgi:dTDP-4-amino-4,6-dideoxygalactose transaminase